MQHVVVREFCVNTAFEYALGGIEHAVYGMELGRCHCGGERGSLGT